MDLVQNINLLGINTSTFGKNILWILPKVIYIETDEWSSPGTAGDEPLSTQKDAHVPWGAASSVQLPLPVCGLSPQGQGAGPGQEGCLL